MENINEHITKLKDQLESFDDLLESSRRAMGGKLAIDKRQADDIVYEIRATLEEMSKDLPNEIKQAKRLIAESDKITSDARNKAALIIKSAEAEAEQLVEDSEIMAKARVQATQMIDEAKKNAREFRKSAVEYADETLSTVEDSVRGALEKFAAAALDVDERINDTINGLYETRKNLRGEK